MSWIYYYEDKPDERDFFEEWLTKHLESRIVPDAVLPGFDDWIQDYQDRLPDLVILDLYTDRDKTPTMEFLSKFCQDQRTRHIPTALLTSGSKERDAPGAFADGDIHAFLSKSDFSFEDSSGWHMRESMSRLLAAHLTALLRRGREQQLMNGLRARLAHLVKSHGIAVFDVQKPFPLLWGTQDAMKFLRDVYGCELGQPAPRPLCAGLADKTSSALTLQVPKGRSIVVGMDRSSETNILVTFRDETSAAYITAVTGMIFQERFKPDMITPAKEQIAARIVDPSDDYVREFIEAYRGYMYGLAKIDLNGTERADDIMDKAETWKSVHLNKIPAVARPLKFHERIAVNKGLQTPGLNEAEEMRDTMRRTIRTCPLVESCR